MFAGTLAFATAPALGSPPAPGSSWVRQFGDAAADDAPSALVATRLGDVFTGGSTNGNLDGTHPTNSAGDGFVTKHDRSGRRRWTRQIDSDPSRADAVTGVSLNGDGDLYVVGSTEGNLDGLHPDTVAGDAFVARYNRSGALLWLQQFGTSGVDAATAVSVSSLGDVYVVGVTNGNLDGTHPTNVSTDGFIARYDRSGVRLWVKQFGTSTASNERATAVLATATGTVYVTGSTTGNIDGLHDPNASTDAVVARYDRTGSRAWVKQVGTESDANETATSLGVGPSGELFVAGSTTGNLDGDHPDAHGDDAWLSRFEATGVVVWTRQLGGPGDDRFSGVGVTAGEPIAAGSTESDLDGTHPGNDSADRLVVRFDSAGQRRWLRQSANASGATTAAAITASPRGEVVTASSVDTEGAETHSDVLLELVDRLALPIWNNQSGHPGNDEANGVAFANDGDVLVAGSRSGDARISRLGVAGSEKWAVSLGDSGDDRFNAIATNRQGEIFAVGTTRSDLDGAHGTNVDGDIVVARYDDTGALLWLRQYGTDGTDEALAVSTTPGGDVFVAGRTNADLDGAHGSNTSWDAFVMRLDHNGDWKWTVQIGAPTTSEEFRGVGSHTSGDVFAGGWTDGNLDTHHAESASTDGLLVRLDRSGSRKWLRQIASEPGRDDEISAVQVNYRGEVFVAGSTAGNLDGYHADSTARDLLIARYSRTGSRQWLRQLGGENTSDDVVRGITTTRTGQVWVTGITSGNFDGRNPGNTTRDALVVGYTRTGFRRAKLQFGTSADDEGRAITVSQRGKVYVVGTTAGSFANVADPLGDAFITRAIG